eukprot:2366753-Prorocentrum_lima.AAC.1
MTSSLVGSEMCIRDRIKKLRGRTLRSGGANATSQRMRARPASHARRIPCLLYTSDAADDM